METLEQIERADLDHKTRAWQLEQVTNELARHRHAVARLTPQLDALSQSLRQLGELQEIASKLSPDITGTSGARCRDQIILSCAAGARSLAQRRDRLMRQLEPAIEKLPILEKQIEEFTTPSPA